MEEVERGRKWKQDKPVHQVEIKVISSEFVDNKK